MAHKFIIASDVVGTPVDRFAVEMGASTLEKNEFLHNIGPSMDAIGGLGIESCVVLTDGLIESRATALRIVAELGDRDIDASWHTSQYLGSLARLKNIAPVEYMSVEHNHKLAKDRNPKNNDAPYTPGNLICAVSTELVIATAQYGHIVEIQSGRMNAEADVKRGKLFTLLQKYE